MIRDRSFVALLAATLAGTTLCVGLLAPGILPGAAFTQIFRFLLENYDFAAAKVSLALVLAALALSPFLGGMGGIARALGRSPWKVAMAAGAAMALAARFAYHAHPLSMDEYAVWFQSRVFATGSLAGAFPPAWLDRLVPLPFQDYFLIVSRATGEVASVYWPGFALLMTPFALAGAQWLCNPVLAALTLVATARVCAIVFPEDEGVAGWAMLFCLASPAFVALGISYYAMTALLLANLLFAWAFLVPTPRRLFLAGVAGSAALVMHNPVPHLLFAAPWLAWFLYRRPAARDVLALAAGYAPLTLLLGVGWSVFKAHLAAGNAGSAAAAPVPGLADAVATQLAAAFSAPSPAILWMRLAGTIKLWVWAVPGLLVLAVMGYAQRRESVPVRLLGASAALTFAGYFFVPYDQGHGWGYRYFHSAWGVLPILAAAAVARRTRPPGPPSRWSLPGLAGAFALAGLLVLVPLQLRNIDEFIAAILAQVPQAPAERAGVAFLYPGKGFYLMDLVQNDPFLREPMLRMVGQGPEADADFLQRSGYRGTALPATPLGQVLLIEGKTP